MKSICVYCGSNAGSKPIYADRAARSATHAPKACAGVRRRQRRLVGIVADAVLSAGGEVTGVIPAACGLKSRIAA